MCEWVSGDVSGIRATPRVLKLFGSLLPGSSMAAAASAAKPASKTPLNYKLVLLGKAPTPSPFSRSEPTSARLFFCCRPR